MDVLETFFSKSPDSLVKEEIEDGSGDEDMEMDTSNLSFLLTPSPSSFEFKPLPISPPPKVSKRNSNRPDRGRFTIMDDNNVAAIDEILDIEFSVELIHQIFKDLRQGIIFLARYGLIPNQRTCHIDTCPKEQMMSLIKHANGYVWRCRSCRKRREKQTITKISVFEGTFLFYSRMPLNKFFVFMLVWCENPGLTIAEYNNVLGTENRLVEETIYNTIGFVRDHLQNWCHINNQTLIGGVGKHVELVETLHTGQLSCRTRNRRTRNYESRYVLICWEDEAICITEFNVNAKDIDLLRKILRLHVVEGSTLVMQDALMEAFGDEDHVRANVGDNHIVKTIADVWPELGADERRNQYIKTIMYQVPNALMEPFAYEYFFRRVYREKLFNRLLQCIRIIYTK